MEQVPHIVSTMDFSFLITIAIYLLIIGMAWFISRRLDPVWRIGVHLVIIILIFRIIAFENPVAWYIYSNTLDPEVIGWRQSSVLYDEFVQFKSHEETKYLAVGSSQTEAIYNIHSYNNPEFHVKSLAALGPLDMYLYRNNILQYDPEVVLLYLSEFDMAREPEWNASKIAPSQGLAFPLIYRDFNKWFSGSEFRLAMKEMIAGELLPEYKYSFIFKGYIDQLFNKASVFPVEGNMMSDEERQEYQFSRLASALSEDNLEVNFNYLEKFLNHLDHHGISVIIIEGQYHPKAYTPRNLQVREIVRQRFIEMDYSYAHTRFIPEDEVLQFAASDYKDAYHVHHESGVKFSQLIVEILNNTDRPRVSSGN